MSLVWVPRREIAGELAAVTTHVDRERVLVSHRDEILEDVAVLLADSTISQLREQDEARDQAEEALQAARAGFDRAAQSLFASALGHVLEGTLGFERPGKAFKDRAKWGGRVLSAQRQRLPRRWPHAADAPRGPAPPLVVGDTTAITAIVEASATSGRSARARCACTRPAHGRRRNVRSGSDGLCAKVGEHGKYAPVGVRCHGEIQLAEDVGHVLFDRPLGHYQALGHRVVREAFGH